MQCAFVPLLSQPHGGTRFLTRANYLFLPCRHSRAGSCILRVSFFFLLLLSSSSFFFLSGNTSFSHTSLHSILTKLSQSDRYLDHYSRTKDGGVRGHHGVTGVKKVIFTKKASSPLDYIALTSEVSGWECNCENVIFGLSVRAISVPLKYLKVNFSLKRKVVHRIIWNTGNQFTVEIGKKMALGDRSKKKEKEKKKQYDFELRRGCPKCHHAPWGGDVQLMLITKMGSGALPKWECPPGIMSLAQYTQKFTTDPKGQALAMIYVVS